MASQEKYTILYGRLSQEDMQKRSGKEDDSNSIQNQRLLLEKYAADKGFTNTRFIYDDGYTGTNFNRPGWQEVMELIESEQVSTLIVKDMSRLGREYLQVGQYTELVFPSYGVRFIAVNDGVDSLVESSNDFTPFRNIINEFYCKDCSNKGRAVVKIKAQTGARIASRPLYGYMKDPEDPKSHIVPDPDTAPVVKRIFTLCADGMGPSKIAQQLEADQIPTPSYYCYEKYGVKLTGLDTSRPFAWSATTISRILENETYLGVTVNMKTTTVSYKNKKRIDRPESEQFRFEGTHEPLIDRQTWEIVQENRRHKRRYTKFTEPSLFSGLVYCMDCGAVMTYHRTHGEKEAKARFICSNYRKNSKTTCSVHGIREEDLYAIVLDDLRRVTHFARQNERKFAEYIGMKRTKEAQKEMRSLEKQISAMTKRQSELMSLFKRLYEDNVLGRIPDEQYRILSTEYTSEQENIKAALPELTKHLQELKDSTSNFDRFLDNARKYTEINELTPELLHTFIKRIEVSERARKYSRTASQDIIIHYRDIGIVDDMPQELEDILRQVAEMDGDITYAQEPVFPTGS